MSPLCNVESNRHNILQFDHFSKTVGVNNGNVPHKFNNIMMPVIVNNQMNLNSCGGGNLCTVMLSNVCHDTYVLDTVSNVNMYSYKVNNQRKGFHRVQHNNAYSTPQHGSPPLSMIAHMEPDHKPLLQAPHGSLHKVDRFNYKFIEQSYSSVNQLVYIHNYPQNKPGGFYFLKTIHGIPHISIYECLSHPVGALYLCDSLWLCVYPAVSKVYNTLSRQEATRVYDNYKQDCLSRQRYGMSYENYMNHIIDSLIESQPNIDANDQGFNLELTPPRVKDIDVQVRSPTQLPTDQRLNKKLSRDTNYASKEWGYISLQPTEFKFIGPDRPGIDPRNVDQYLHLAKIVEESGVPNYRQVRVPIKSGINVNAWRRHLCDYKDHVIIQYLQYGFPLSIKNPDSLHEQNSKKHFSAIHHNQAVSSYLTKERQHGAILGPIPNLNKYLIHCSPLLTRPKDKGKRRVILDLSYPSGLSLNDHIDKDFFDASACSLRFPSVDIIVHEIAKHGDDVTLAKIDIERAFRNLCVDPADTMKLGIKWQNDTYIDAAIAFGWVHGSAAFHCVSDAITFIAAKAGINMVAYIDDYILISPKDTAQDHFDTLASILSELGLPSNPEKQTPPCRALTCLGIRINIDANTLSIDPQKLHSIHTECRQTQASFDKERFSIFTRKAAIPPQVRCSSPYLHK